MTCFFNFFLVLGNLLFSMIRPKLAAKQETLLENDAMKDLSGGSPCCGGAVLDEDHKHSVNSN